MTRKRSPKERDQNMTRIHNPATRKDTKRADGAHSWEKGKTKNGKSPNGSSARMSATIERYLKGKEWKRARALIQEQLVFEPADHWLWMHLGLTYYEEKEYEKAVRCSQWAVQLEPRCPLGLWHLAGALYMTGDEAAAVAVWISLLHMDVEEVAFGEHGEGMDRALQLINDIHYRMGRYYHRIGEDRLAAESFRKHLHNRHHGVSSSYDIKETEELLAQVSHVA